MSDFTDATETDGRDWLFKGVDMPPAPTSLEVSLHNSDPGDSPDGSTEVSAADYSRVSTSTGTDWDAIGENAAENAVKIDFGTTQNDWGTITHAVLWDNNGVARAKTTLDNAGETPTGIEVYYPAGTLDFTFD